MPGSRPASAWRCSHDWWESQCPGRDGGRRTRAICRVLSGRKAVRLEVRSLIVVVSLALLTLFYEWLGSKFLDTGGSIG